MADVTHYIPFILRWETGAIQRKEESIPALFERAKKTGWGDHPLDHGGATMCGITIGTYTTYCRRKGLPAPTKAKLKGITLSEWTEILKTMFWDVCKADNIRSQGVAEAFVDWMWGSGITGIKRAQRLLGVTADGIVGPKTLSAINAREPRQLFAAIHNARLAHFDEIVRRNPSQKIWLKGWRNRVNSQTYE